MTRLTSLTVAEKKFLDDVLFAAERASGKKLSGTDKKRVLEKAREQIAGERYAAKQRELREQERQAAAFTWSKPKHFRR